MIGKPSNITNAPRQDCNVRQKRGKRLFTWAIWMGTWRSFVLGRLFARLRITVPPVIEMQNHTEQPMKERSFIREHGASKSDQLNLSKAIFAAL